MELSLVRKREQVSGTEKMMKARMFRSKRCSIFNIFLVIITGVALTLALINILSLQGDLEHHVGNASFAIINAEQSAQKAISYAEQSAEYSAEQSAYDLGQAGGNSGYDDCGTYGGFNMWNNGNDVCLPEPEQSFIDILGTNLDSYLGTYPALDFLEENYDFRLDTATEIMKIMARARSDIKFGLDDGGDIYSGFYKTNPSLKTELNYSFDIYDNIEYVMEEVMKRCATDLTYTCIAPVIADKTTFAERYEHTDIITQQKSIRDTGFDYVIKFGDEILTVDSSNDPEVDTWNDYCEPHKEHVVNDILDMYGRCYSTTDDKCWCKYPIDSFYKGKQAYLGDAVRQVRFEPVGFDPYLQTYRVSLYSGTPLPGAEPVYNTYLITDTRNRLPEMLYFDSSDLFGRLLFRDHMSGAETLFPNRKMYTKGMKSLYLYKDGGGLRFAQLNPSQQIDYLEFVDGTSVEFDPNAECEQPEVLKVCVIDREREMTVYDVFEGKVVHDKNPVIKFAYEVRDDTPPPPLPEPKAYDALYKESSLLLKWEKSEAGDTEKYNIYYVAESENNPDHFSLATEFLDDHQVLIIPNAYPAPNKIEKREISLQGMPVNRIEGDIDLSTCKFDYTLRSCLYPVIAGADTSYLLLEDGTLYNFYSANHDYYVYILNSLLDAERYDIGITAVDKFGNEIDNDNDKIEVLRAADPEDDLAPDIVEPISAMITTAGNLRLEWTPVRANLDRTYLDPSDLSGYWVYRSCLVPDNLISSHRVLTSSESWEIPMTTLNSESMSCGFGVTNYDMYFVIIAQDKNDNPNPTGFDGNEFDKWRNYGLKIIKTNLNPNMPIPPSAEIDVLEEIISDIPQSPITDMMEVEEILTMLVAPYPDNIPPLNKLLTSAYGYREVCINGACDPDFHSAIDINLAEQTPVLAMANGIVWSLSNECTDGSRDIDGCTSGRGNWVIIEHPDIGMATRYSHLYSVEVSQGQEVTAGELIAHSGNTGHSTGAHLDTDMDDDDDEDGVWFNNMPGEDSEVPQGESEVKVFCYLPFQDFQFSTPSCSRCPAMWQEYLSCNTWGIG